jgi:glycosyltransferase involved in cell wall biosynthesis
MIKCFFVGHFSSIKYKNSLANSSAGNQVQNQIFNDICNIVGNDSSICFAMQPMPVWPKGDFLIYSTKEGNIIFPGFVNLPILKNIIFSIHLIFYTFKKKPTHCIQYNSYLFENLALLLFKLISKNSKISLIVQDINCDIGIKISKLFDLKILGEKIGLFLLRFFDFVVPISDKIATDFKIKKERYFVFQGGLTDFSYSLLSNSNLVDQISKEKFAVFAGALEPYNGIDKIVNQWIKEDIRIPLHVFGRGSLSERVKLKADSCKYVIFHGFQSEKIVENWIVNANWNFCLRYSIQINQDYFFPSKFFSLLCLNSTLICNKFNNIPDYFFPQISFVDDNLDNLASIIKDTTNPLEGKNIEKCRLDLIKYHSWNTCIEKLLNII